MLEEIAKWFWSWGWIVCIGALLFANSSADRFFKEPKTANFVISFVATVFLVLLVISLFY